jgi:dihydrofolate reductase
MRKVIFAINITLDGCCDHTKMIADDEVHEYFTQLLREADALVYGRKTYQLMVPFWPDVAKSQSGETKAINEFAQAFDSVGEIIVFSQSLDRAEGKNTRIVRARPQEEILRLKQGEGKNILLGGVNIPSQLIGHGLIDEFRIVIHPVVAGQGRRLFESISLPDSLPLKLAESRRLKLGHIALRYSSVASLQTADQHRPL